VPRAELLFRVRLASVNGENSGILGRRQATDRAQAEAVRKSIGTQVQAERQSSTIERDKEVVSRFSQVVRTGAGGRVVDYKVLEERRPERNGEIFQYVRIEAKVESSTGRPDPGFAVYLKLTDEDGTVILLIPEGRDISQLKALRW